MKKMLIQKILAIITIVAGIGLIIYGLQYNLSHFDNYLDHSHSFFQANTVLIGFLVLSLAPLILRKYLWFGIQLALTLGLIFFIVYR